MKLRPYTAAELRMMRRDYSAGAYVDNKRLAEAGAPYYVTVAGDARCRKCRAAWRKYHRCKRA